MVLNPNLSCVINTSGRIFGTCWGGAIKTINKSKLEVRSLKLAILFYFVFISIFYTDLQHHQTQSLANYKTVYFNSWRMFEKIWRIGFELELLLTLEHSAGFLYRVKWPPDLERFRCWTRHVEKVILKGFLYCIM